MSGEITRARKGPCSFLFWCLRESARLVVIRAATSPPCRMMLRPKLAELPESLLLCSQRPARESQCGMMNGAGCFGRLQTGLCTGPGEGGCYSQEFQDRALGACDRGVPTSEIARTMRVSPAWARRLKRRSRIVRMWRREELKSGQRDLNARSSTTTRGAWPTWPACAGGPCQRAPDQQDAARALDDHHPRRGA